MQAEESSQRRFRVSPHIPRWAMERMVLARKLLNEEFYKLTELRVVQYEEKANKEASF
jgi:hypothetical protein